MQLAVTNAPSKSAVARLSTAPLERWTDTDRCYDYCLLPYDARGPVDDALRSVNLLRESFALEGVESEGMRVVDLLRQGFGSCRTVWGIKRHRTADATSWELYFYDHDRSHPDVSVAHIARVLAPALVVDAEEAWPTKRLMFSIEFDAAQLRARGPVPAHVYIERTGLSYELRGRTLTLESLYRFLDARREMPEIVRLVKQSVRLDPAATPLAALLPPELVRCRHICVAQKRLADALYFSRVDERQLAWFLERFGWPAPLRAFVAQERARLAHLSWDVGFDFRTVEGRLETVKSGVYGTF